MCVCVCLCLCVSVCVVLCLGFFLVHTRCVDHACQSLGLRTACAVLCVCLCIVHTCAREYASVCVCVWRSQNVLYFLCVRLSSWRFVCVWAQVQSPLFVQTKLASIRKASLDVPSPKTYARSAVAHIGYETKVEPPHSDVHVVLWCNVVCICVVLCVLVRFCRQEKCVRLLLCRYILVHARTRVFRSSGVAVLGARTHAHHSP